jgi:hypothetical protein
MSDGDGKLMLQNPPSRPEIDRVLHPVEAGHSPAAEPLQPAGTVKRTLNFRDRNLLIGAARNWCSRDGQKKLKDQDKLVRLAKLVYFEETLEYIAMIADAQEEVERKWRADWKRYKLWRNFQEGLISEEELTKDVDRENGVPKPTLLMPEITPAEMRGRSRDFFFPSKLDAWAQNAVEGMDWNFNAAEYAVELAEKFGVEVER